MVNHLGQLVKRVNYVMSAGLLEDFPRCSNTSLDFILWKISYSFQAIDIHVIAVPENYQHTTNSEQKEASGNGLKALENGGRGWI
tara:strand:+ start:2051 stop:2305 length:255 start_codon:yes stop_codon:yes gene_type:complete